MLDDYLAYSTALENYNNLKDNKTRELELRMNLLEMALQLIEERLEKCEKRTDTYCSQQK